MPLIDDKPEQAKWISKEEREYVVNAIRADQEERKAAFAAKGQVTSSYKEMFQDKHLWLFILIYMSYTTGSYGYTIWLPTLLKNLTKMNLINVGFLASVPFVAAVFGMYLFGALADRKGNRRLYTSLALTGLGVCFGLSTIFPGRVWLVYGLIIAAGLFAKSIQGPFWSMTALVFQAGVSGGARGAIGAFGNLGGFIGPVLLGWITTMTGSMAYGIYSLVIVLFVGSAITMLLPKVTAGYRYQEKEKIGSNASV
jgi:nitrate/nitrite transporter NarK